MVMIICEVCTNSNRVSKTDKVNLKVKNMRVNEKNIREMYKFLAHESQTEIRLISPVKGALKPIFVSNEEEFVRTCEKYNEEYNVYAGINERRTNGTETKDVISVKTIVIDIDAKRQGTNSKEAATKEELKKAEEVADKIIADCITQGFKPPTKIMSGNGYHLMFAIPKMEITDATRDLVETQIKAFIDMLKSKYETEDAGIDQIGDLARIIKVCGTLSIKGQNTEERPHRLSHSCTEFVRNEDIALWEDILSIKPSLNQDILTRKVESDYWEILKTPDATEQERCSCVMQIYHTHKTWNLNDAFDFIVKENEWEDFNPGQTFLKMQEVWKRYVPNQKEKSLSEKVLELLTIKQRTEATEILAKEFQNTNHVYTIRDDKFAESWVYSEGIYVPNGQTYICEFCRNILGKAYTRQLAKDVISKVETDTFIEMKEFFDKENIEEIAVQNGILNVKTKELLPFNPEKIFFNKIPISYNPSKSCPKIKKFFEQILGGDEKSVKAIEEMFGYLLYKNYCIQKGMMFNGEGRNGKSVLLELMKRFVGAQNCSAIPLQHFEKDNFAHIELHRKLANLAGDLDATEIKKSGPFKQLTGKDIISASRKFLPRLEFVNYAKLIFATNKLPRTRDTSLAFFNRWIIFDFPITFLDEKEYYALPENERKNKFIRDVNIIEKLTTSDEMSGLLNEALAGLERLLENKDFTKSFSVKEIERIWVSKSDSFRGFAREYVETDPDSQITKKELRREYNKYCKENRLKPLSDKAIKETLEEDFAAVDAYEDGFSGVACWDGIKLKKEEIKIPAR